MSEKQYPPLPMRRAQFNTGGGWMAPTDLFTEQQMRDYVDADRARRTPLTTKQIRKVTRDAEIAYCLNKYDSFGWALIRVVEEAHGIHKSKESGDV